MDQNEIYYRKVIGSIGVSLLFFLLLLTATQSLLVVGSQIISLKLGSSAWGDALYELLYAATYLSSFMIPVAIMKAQIKNHGIAYQPMKTTFRFSKYAFLAIPLGVSLIFSASYVNSMLVDVFYIPNIMEVLMPTPSKSPDAYELILQFIVIALVPGFCEEFLFRGAILTNCLPFGRSTAILISSLLFALMHQNVQQFFYAFVAGIFLGVLYEMSGSIWPGVIMHTLNNFISTVQGIVPNKFSDAFQGAVVYTLVELVIFLMGVVSLGILLTRFFGKKKDCKGGVFGKELAAADGYAAVPLSAQKLRKLFWKGSMKAFVIICAVESLLVVGLVILYALFV